MMVKHPHTTPKQMHEGGRSTFWELIWFHAFLTHPGQDRKKILIKFSAHSKIGFSSFFSLSFVHHLKKDRIWSQEFHFTFKVTINGYVIFLCFSLPLLYSLFWFDEIIVTMPFTRRNFSCGTKTFFSSFFDDDFILSREI